jgi:hypothetical protein
MIKKHKLITALKFEYYWFGPMHICLQPAFPEIDMLPYARVFTDPTNQNSALFYQLHDVGKLEEITKDEFDHAVGRALDIIHEIKNTL